MTESNDLEAQLPSHPMTDSEKFRKVPNFVGSCDELSDRQCAAIELLLSGASYGDVANTVGVNPRTLYNWRTTDANFREQLKHRRRLLMDSASNNLLSKLSNAVSVLDRQARDIYAPTAHRAARTLLMLARIDQAISDVMDPDVDGADNRADSSGKKAKSDA